MDDTEGRASAGPQFTMHFLDHNMTIEQHIKEKRLRPIDCVVLQALENRMNLSTGRIRTRLSVIAEQLGYSHSQLRASFQRLKAQQLVVRCMDDNREIFFLINPYCIHYGTEQKRGRLWQQFKAAVNNGGEMPGPERVLADVVPALGETLGETLTP
jgi:hypothetical protein